MKRIFLLVLICILSVFSATGWAKNVTVEGYGATEQAAKQDALRYAIEDAVGVMVNSKTWVDKASLIEDKVITRSRGYITGYRVVGKSRLQDGWRVVVNAEVVDDPSKVKALMNILTKEGLVQDVLGNPRIAVLIQDKKTGEENTALETAVVKSFMSNGFTNIVDIGERRQELFNGSLEAMDLAADVLIVGEVSNEAIGDVGRFLPENRTTGIESCRAIVNARIYNVKTGRIWATDSRSANGVGISQEIAQYKANQKVAETLSNYLVEQVLVLAAKIERNT